MASILTNTSAMTALQNLRSINSNLVNTQNEIATGKKISNARDNAAIWAVSKVLESDVSGFKAISDSLNLGQSPWKNPSTPPNTWPQKATAKSSSPCAA